MSCCMALFKIKKDATPENFDEVKDDFKLGIDRINALVSNYKGAHRTLKQLEDMYTIHEFDYEIKDWYSYIPCEFKDYAQGWFFKQSFLSRKYPFYLTTKKKGMINFMNRNLKFENPEVVKIFNSFVSNWDDDEDMIFYCSF